MRVHLNCLNLSSRLLDLQRMFLRSKGQSMCSRKWQAHNSVSWLRSKGLCCELGSLIRFALDLGWSLSRRLPYSGRWAWQVLAEVECGGLPTNRGWAFGGPTRQGWWVSFLNILNSIWGLRDSFKWNDVARVYNVYPVLASRCSFQVLFSLRSPVIVVQILWCILIFWNKNMDAATGILSSRVWKHVQTGSTRK